MKLLLSAITTLTVLSAAVGGDTHGCAHLEERRLCVPAGTGNEEYVVSERPHNQIRVTVRETTHCQDGPFETEKVYPIPAGGEQFVGCTKKYSDCMRVTFEIVGCEVLPSK